MWDFFRNLFRLEVATQSRNVKTELDRKVAEQEASISELAKQRASYDDEIRRQKALKTQSENDISVLSNRLEKETDVDNIAALEKRLNSERHELKEKIEQLDRLLNNYESFCDTLSIAKVTLDQLKSQVKTAVVLNGVASSQLNKIDIEDDLDELKQDTLSKESKIKVRKMFE